MNIRFLSSTVVVICALAAATANAQEVGVNFNWAPISFEIGDITKVRAATVPVSNLAQVNASVIAEQPLSTYGVRLNTAGLKFGEEGRVFFVGLDCSEARGRVTTPMVATFDRPIPIGTQHQVFYLNLSHGKLPVEVEVNIKFRCADGSIVNLGPQGLLTPNETSPLQQFEVSLSQLTSKDKNSMLRVLEVIVEFTYSMESEKIPLVEAWNAQWKKSGATDPQPTIIWVNGFGWR